MSETEQLALARVAAALEKYGDLQAITFSVDTSTAELAAQAVGVAVGQIAKSLCFLGDGQPFLVVTVGDRKMDTRKLGKQVGVKKVRFADADTAYAATGFLPGGVCPFALKTSLPVYVDESLFQYDMVYASAGTASSALPITPTRLKEITGGRVVDATTI